MSCTEHRSLGSAWIEIIREEFTRKDVTVSPHLFTIFQVNRLAVTSNTIQHPCFNAISTNCLLTQLTRAPVWKEGSPSDRRPCMKQISNETLMTWIPYLIHNCFLSPTINHPTCRAYGSRLWTYQESNGTARVAHSYRDYSWRQMSTWQSWQLAVWW